MSGRPKHPGFPKRYVGNGGSYLHLEYGENGWDMQAMVSGPLWEPYPMDAPWPPEEQPEPAGEPVPESGDKRRTPERPKHRGDHKT